MWYIDEIYCGESWSRPAFKSRWDGSPRSKEGASRPQVPERRWWRSTGGVALAEQDLVMIETGGRR